ncbi:MAG: serine hydroxymethyltransferase [Methanomicrobia archaeon]|nr:serine hydroxymethyltransferase [Methanomicrobia archaeon]
MSFEKIKDYIEKQEIWRKHTINLIASENITSPAAKRAVASGFMHKYAEGWPKQRYYQGCKYIDEVELLGNSAFYQLFNADYVDLRPVSGAVANISMFFGLTRPGDTIISLDTSDGGHITHAKFGAAGLRGLNVVEFPYDEEEMNIDTDKTIKRINEVNPKLILFGGSVFLFPHPVKEIAETSDAIVVYDAAHVLGLIAGKQFQDPFKEGAKIMTASTHKTFPGPQGGVLMAKNLDQQNMTNVQWAIFPGCMSNHHLHHVAGKAITAYEMLKYGEDYAKQTIKNAQKFGEAMTENGFKVAAEHKGFTKSHQIVLDFKEYIGKWAAETLEEANIITNKNLLPWDPVENSSNPSGMRLGTQEMTRVGMKESEMEYIAELFKKVLLDKKDPKEIRKEVSEFRKDYQEIHYGFNW